MEYDTRVSNQYQYITHLECLIPFKQANEGNYSTFNRCITCMSIFRN